MNGFFDSIIPRKRLSREYGCPGVVILGVFFLLCGFFGEGRVLASGGGGLSGWIVFSSNASGNWDLWAVHPETHDMKRLTKTSRTEHSPVVSLKRRDILYVDQKRRIRVMSADSSESKGLPLPQGIYAHPAWAPDERQVAYVLYRVIPSDASDIWIIRKKSGVWGYPEPVTAFPPMRIFPAFSPDGTRLAYAEFKRDPLLGVVEEIGMYHFEKKWFRKITDHGADSYEPAWSPDGERLAYTSDKAGNYDIWITDLRDGRHSALTRNPAYDGEPSWSPEGSRIVFVSSRSGRRELHVMSVAGGRPRPLTKLGKTCKDPFWVK